MLAAMVALTQHIGQQDVTGVSTGWSHLLEHFSHLNNQQQNCGKALTVTTNKQ